METSDILVHKGEKDDKYQLYIEDYVMSYLKKQGGVQRSRKIFFFGKRELREKKYYIYGAGLQRQIDYFADYEKLHEITCRYVMDMPVFSIQEKNKVHELTGYYIFYQTNEAMQNYMIELRAEQEKGETGQGTEFYNASCGEITGRQIERAAHTEQKIFDRKKQWQQEKEKNYSVEETKVSMPRTNVSFWYKPKGKNRILAILVTAILIVLTAIVINTTNSYGKLEDLNQAAVEVFFAMENEEAAVPEKQAEEVVQMEGTTLYLAELEAQQTEQREEISGTATENEQTFKNAESLQKAAAEDIETTQNTEESHNMEMEQNTENTQSIKTSESADTAQGRKNTQSTDTAQKTEVQYYQIQRGDTLYTISQKLYGNTDNVNKICEMNQIENPDNIKYGQKILLP